MAITRIADATKGIRAGYSPITSITANRNLDFRDAGAILSSTTNANITLTLTNDTTGNWPSDSRVILSSDATGYQVEVLPAAGVTLDDPSGTSTVQPSEPLQLIRTGANNWRAYGGTGGFTGRGVLAGGSGPGVTYFSTMEYINIASAGNSVNFGTLTLARYGVSALASSTRGVFSGGYSGVFNNNIDYITIATTGNAIAFGNLTTGRQEPAGCSSSTRGLNGGGYTGSISTVIDYITIATTGNAIAFGNLISAKYGLSSCSSPTRGVFSPGSGTNTTNIEYVQIDTLGNGINFGALSQGRIFSTAASNNTRAVFMGGYTTGSLPTIDYITIATTGNAIAFGNLIIGHSRGNSGGNAASSVRGIVCGDQSAGASQITIEYVVLATLGSAASFGNLTQSRGYAAMCSNAHGGL